MPTVSVVIPAYNNADFIEATIRSVLSQEGVDFELIVADHSSTDDTLAIVQRFADDPRVTVLTTPTGGGAKANWDRVSQAATGEFLKLLPGDDLLYPGALAAQAEALAAHPGSVLVSSRRDVLDARGAILFPSPAVRGTTAGRHDGVEAVRVSIRQGTNIFGEPGCTMMRRNALEAIGWWDDRAPYLIDQASYALVLRQGDYVALDRTLGGFRVNAGQWSVRLVGEQARQAKAFHRSFRALEPDRVSQWDVRFGDLRSEIRALARRAFYLVYRRRLSAAG